MGNEKIMNSRMQQKHDIEANWNKADNFYPKAGEIIVYDPDETHDYPRVKIGDGEHLLKDLPFTTDFLLNGIRFNTDASLTIPEEYYITVDKGYINEEDGSWIEVMEEVKVGEASLSMDKNSILLNYNYDDRGMSGFSSEKSENSFLELTKDNIKMHKDKIQSGTSEPTHDLNINLDSIELTKTVYYDGGTAVPELKDKTSINPGSILVSQTPVEGWYAPQTGDNTITIDPLTGITITEYYDTEFEGTYGADTETATITARSFNNKAEKSDVNTLNEKVQALSSVGLKREIVSALPDIEDAKENAIYMVGVGEGYSMPTSIIMHCGEHDETFTLDVSDEAIFHSMFDNQPEGQYIFTEVDINDGVIYGNFSCPEGATITRPTEGSSMHDYGINPASDVCCSAYYKTITVTIKTFYSSYDEYMYISAD